MGTSGATGARSGYRKTSSLVAPEKRMDSSPVVRNAQKPSMTTRQPKFALRIARANTDYRHTSFRSSLKARAAVVQSADPPALVRDFGQSIMTMVAVQGNPRVGHVFEAFCVAHATWGLARSRTTSKRCAVRPITSTMPRFAVASFYLTMNLRFELLIQTALDLRRRNSKQELRGCTRKFRNHSAVAPNTGDDWARLGVE